MQHDNKESYNDQKELQKDNKDTESDQIFILNDDKQHLCRSWCLGLVLWGVGPSHNPSLQKWETYLETPQHPGRSCRKPPCSRLQIHIQSERLGARWTSEGSHHQHVYTMKPLWGFVKNVWSWYSRVRSLAALPRSRFVSWPAGILPRLKYKRDTVKTSADGFSRLERIKRWNAADLLLDRRYGAPQTSVSPAAHSHRSFLQPERRRTEF